MGFQYSRLLKLTDRNFRECEQNLLLLSGCQLNEFWCLNVIIDNYPNGSPIYIRTIICGSESKPKLVMLPSYYGAGALMFRILKPLMDKYCLILHDTIGTGGSSRLENYYYN